MRVLLIGGGGREHALAAALAASPSVDALFVAPGNPGTATIARNLAVAADDVPGLVAAARRLAVDLVVPGPEAALVAGLADACAAAGLACAGPSAAASRLEGSKRFARSVADAAGIPGPLWQACAEPDEAIALVRRLGAPVVVKADGLAAGKGVVIAATVDDAIAAIERVMRDRALGNAGATVVIEECLAGDEVSLFALCDGRDAVLLGAAQDHKRVGDGDTGPNTGGMGAVSPPRGFGRVEQEAALGLFVRPLLAEMAARGMPFRGVLFTGLMLTAHGPRLIEYNVRFGDPEAQCLLPLLRSDLALALKACTDGTLSAAPWTLADEASVAVVLAAPGYPGTIRTGDAIGGIETAAGDGVRVFQAATRRDADGGIVTAGGRVLAVQATAPTLRAARDAAYGAVARVAWPGALFRRDIGARSII